MEKLLKTRVLTISAMLTAVGIVLGLFKLPINQLIEIRFGSLPIAVCGMLFGPGVAGVVGGLVDIGGYLVKPTGPFFPGFTLSAIVGGVIYGLMLHGRKVTVARVFVTQAIYTLVVGILMNTYWLSMLYLKNGYLAALIARLPQELIMLPVMTVMQYIMLSALERIGVKRFSV